MSFLTDFARFARRGNLIDLAIGFTVGAAFSTIAKSLVTDVIMPPVGLLTGNTDFTDKFWVLKVGTKAPEPYVTLADAQAAGAVTLNYGVFINNVVAFILVALAMFFIVRLLNRGEQMLGAAIDKDEAPPAKDEPTQKECPFCRTTIAWRASRCPHCTSRLQLPPELMTEARRAAEAAVDAASEAPAASKP